MRNELRVRFRVRFRVQKAHPHLNGPLRVRRTRVRTLPAAGTVGFGCGFGCGGVQRVPDFYPQKQKQRRTVTRAPTVP
jgi:hypothetical protein